MKILGTNGLGRLVVLVYLLISFAFKLRIFTHFLKKRKIIDFPDDLLITFLQ